MGDRYRTPDLGDVIVINTEVEARGRVTAVRTQDWDAFEAVTRREGDEFVRTEIGGPDIYWVSLLALEPRA